MGKEVFGFEPRLAFVWCDFPERIYSRSPMPYDPYVDQRLITLGHRWVEFPLIMVARPAELRTKLFFAFLAEGIDDPSTQAIRVTDAALGSIGQRRVPLEHAA